ncbi:accessory gene regulator ArgB-like protein [Clostridium botulinum]|uniref:Accessory regulator AgrB n=1 Tax=Clostridium botulinum TaxID=1491 RepID=A0A846J0L6_CLOBO|nr:accessory gene regulator B family protein [Clostridium botulinum]ACA54345.1 putative AIP processing-secretion protein [Clostridium botulinum A3 str. Loch Maree]NFH63882.1 accessory regulator AgrB [Clostridium botulinum]NFJ07539.1 accessory regulator AgrB [Clostridium botulinum]NFK14511.1 accessory regulator AgrB [Clostridium botulinum]NFM93813.1 accessory regulator AgrB [Clostridium botulinum]
MIFSISKKIVDKLIDGNVIVSEDKDLYTYGFHQGFLMIFNIFTAIAIGILFKMVRESLIFLAAYIPLRSYAGGYHAKTPLRCYIFSIIIMIVVLLGIKFIYWNSFICSIVTFCTTSIIFALKPVEDKNKPLDQKERDVYKRRTKIILFVLLGIGLMFWFIDNKQISITIIMALFIIAFMLILGKIKNTIIVKNY